MIIIPANTISGGYEVANSLRFNDGSSDFLSKTFSSGNRKTWTWSSWIKRATLGANQSLFSCHTSDSDTAQLDLKFDSGDTISYEGKNTVFKTTSRVFRDVSAWYHIMFVLDMTQATASNRMKFYVNGVLETSFATDNTPAQNTDLGINQNSQHAIGMKDRNNSSFFDGYITETVFIDGQALTPTSFGEFDEDTNIWKPIDVSGLTFGTNGFYLDFEDSSALGNDANGSNNFTVNNLTAIDQTTDTCTNNFATGNPLIPSTLTYSDGNCTFERTTDDWESTGSTLAVTQGKWYAEFKWISGTYAIIGVEDMDLVSTWDNLYMGYSVNGRGYGWDGNARNNASTSSFGNTFTTGDIIGVALDMDNKYVYMSKNGVFQNSGDPTSGATGTGGLSLAGTEYVIGVSAYNSKISANFGSPPYTISSGNSDGNSIGNFEYAVPSGYFALCTSNLAEHG